MAKIVQTAGKNALGEFAPVSYTHLDYGVYERALFFLVAADSLEKRGVVVGCILYGVIDFFGFVRNDE